MSQSVAVIGAGPGGLVAARWLSAQGFRVTIFESAPELGGQWSGRPGGSGVWPHMHTNTSRILTAFSDLPPEGTAVFPPNRDILRYLRRYAEVFELVSRIRCGAEVMWDQSGGYFVPMELQARWIAYTWGGTVAARDPRPGVQACRQRRGLSQKTRMNLVALAFARAAGVEPDPARWPQLRRALLFGPLAPSCFRLEGPDALPDAATRFACDAAEFGAITDVRLTEREQRYLDMVERAG